MGGDVTLNVHNLHTGVVYTINGFITEDGEVFNKDTGKRIFPLENKDKDTTHGNIIAHDNNHGVISNLVKTIEVLRNKPEYTSIIGSILDSKDVDTDELITKTLDILKNPEKFKDTKAYEQLSDLLNKIPMDT